MRTVLVTNYRQREDPVLTRVLRELTQHGKLCAGSRAVIAARVSPEQTPPPDALRVLAYRRDTVQKMNAFIHSDSEMAPFNIECSIEAKKRKADDDHHTPEELDFMREEVQRWADDTVADLRASLCGDDGDTYRLAVGKPVLFLQVGGAPPRTPRVTARLGTLAEGWPLTCINVRW